MCIVHSAGKKYEIITFIIIDSKVRAQRIFSTQCVIGEFVQRRLLQFSTGSFDPFGLSYSVKRSLLFFVLNSGCVMIFINLLD